MNKKLLAISICVSICFALLAIPAFATSVPETTSAPNVFDTLLSGEAQELTSYTLTVSTTINTSNHFLDLYSWLVAVGATSSSTAVGDFYVQNTNGAHYSNCAIYAESPNQIRYIGYYLQAIISGSATISSADGYGEALAIGSSVSLAPVYTAVPGDGLVQAFAGEVFTVGGGLISFVMSHWIVLIPVVAFLVILCIGAIRKIIKGV